VPLIIVNLLLCAVLAFLCDFYYNTIKYRPSPVDATPISELRVEEISRIEDAIAALENYVFLELRYMFDTSDPDYEEKCYAKGVAPYAVLYMVNGEDIEYQPGYNYLAKRFWYNWHRGESWLAIEIYVYKDTLPERLRMSLQQSDRSYSEKAPVEQIDRNENGTAVELLQAQGLRGISKMTNREDASRWNTVSGICFGNVEIILSEMQAEGQTSLSNEFIALLCNMLKSSIPTALVADAQDSLMAREIRTVDGTDEEYNDFVEAYFQNAGIDPEHISFAYGLDRYDFVTEHNHYYLFIGRTENISQYDISFHPDKSSPCLLSIPTGSDEGLALPYCYSDDCKYFLSVMSNVNDSFAYELSQIFTTTLLAE